MKLYICPNNKTNEQLLQTVHLIEVLKDRLDAKVSLSEANIQWIGEKAELDRFSPEECDYIVSLGGDGAVLRGAKVAIEAKKPLFAVNSGRVGYLCTLPFEEIDQLTEEKFRSFPLSERSLLSLTYNGQTVTAVNDVFVAKKNFGEAIDLKMTFSRGKVLRFRGDGVILATPTGSTSYNLSAGGPSISPSVPCFAVTPICPHFSDAHPEVVADSEIIRIELMKADSGAGIYADGTYIGDVEGQLLVTCAPERFLLLEKIG